MDRAIAVVGSARVVRGGGSALRGRKEKSRRNIEAYQARVGQAVGQSQDGLLMRSKWKETRRFPDRQVSTQGTEKAEVEAMILGHHGTDCPNSTWRYYR